MTSDEYRAALDRLGLTQAGAARLFRIGARTGRRWAEIGIEGTPVVLIQLMLAGKVSKADIEGLGKSDGPALDRVSPLLGG